MSGRVRRLPFVIAAALLIAAGGTAAFAMLSPSAAPAPAAPEAAPETPPYTLPSTDGRRWWNLYGRARHMLAGTHVAHGLMLLNGKAYGPALKQFDAAIALDPTQFDESALKAPAITEAASVVAAIPEVRQALMNYQSAFATKPPGAVLDGRDIGTVIAPGADVKIFVVATPDVRAARRTAEMRARGEPADEREVLADLLRRDERDSRRTAAPLKAAPDAHLLDTTHLGIDAAFRAAVDIIEAVRTVRKRG